MSDIADKRKQRKWLLYLKAKTSQVNSGLDTESKGQKTEWKMPAVPLFSQPHLERLAQEVTLAFN